LKPKTKPKKEEKSSGKGKEEAGEDDPMEEEKVEDSRSRKARVIKKEADDEVLSIPIKGGFGTKIDTLVKLVVILSLFVTRSLI